MSSTVQNRPRGIYLNQPQAQCSIYESGMMVYRALQLSDHYSLEYFALSPETAHAIPAADFYIMNYHHATMQWLNTASVRALPGKVITVVLEMLPGNPFVYVSPDHFDAYVVLDPTIRIAHQNVYAFPRPLEAQAPTTPYIEKPIPWIGTFGFSTPGKGFELVVDAVNREFERARIRINIPPGTFADSHAALLQRRNYAEYLTELCQRVAHPGIEVEVTQAFLTKTELIDWCSQNTLNCFLYCRNQPGLSATTDQCISAGRPLAVSANETFRHIHQYLPPYPERSLKESIAESIPAVERMRHEWTPQAFANRFAEVLHELGVLAPQRPLERWTPPSLPTKQRVRVTMPEPSGFIDQLLCFAAAGAVKRSRYFQHAGEHEAADVALAIGSAEVDTSVAPTARMTVSTHKVGALSLCSGTRMTALTPLIPLHCNELLLPEVTRLGCFLTTPALSLVRSILRQLSTSTSSGEIFFATPGIDRSAATAFQSELQRDPLASAGWQVVAPPAATTPLELLAAMSACTALVQPLQSVDDTVVFGFALATQRPIAVAALGAGEAGAALETLRLETMPIEQHLSRGIAPLVPLYNDWSETRFILALRAHLEGARVPQSHTSDRLTPEAFLNETARAHLLRTNVSRALQIHAAAATSLSALAELGARCEVVDPERNFSLEQFYELPTTVLESYDLVIATVSREQSCDRELLVAEIGDLLAPGGTAVLTLAAGGSDESASGPPFSEQTIRAHYLQFIQGGQIEEHGVTPLASETLGVVIHKSGASQR